MLELNGLEIRKAIVHHIPKAVDRVTATAACSDELVDLPPAGFDMFSRRIAKALGSKSKGIKVDIERDQQGSFFQSAAQAMEAGVSEENFIQTSKEIAQNLCNAQGIKGLVESKLLVMSGVTGEFQRPFLVVVKADMQDALAEVPKESGSVSIDYLDNIFLTDSQRLYKIGFLQQIVATPRVIDGLRNIDQYTMHLFDHLLTAVETRNAAHYFYSDFLGADIAASDKRLTQDFYEKTMRFLQSRGYDADTLIDKSESLRSELRSNDSTISTADFAVRHLDSNEADDYEEYMRSQSFPEHAITKDVGYIKSKIQRRRKFVFSSQVMITTPSDGGNLISIEPSQDGSTTVIVTGTLSKSE
ncbi:nucleoid-associated protein NdpA [Alcaligenes faecalis]|uniref:nucleoid-associated protein n=1 Tax=Alcaligenes faecalis TaxID=511 RepID=UPI0012939C15|nr:nucleoid-associated protein [Alcaligenes faecalis]QFY79782.1 nucleoid-associated protein NdpA [Alcaligenes faecalis]